MIYIENENNVGLYEVEINKENFKKVREKIIHYCSLTTVKVTERTTEKLFMITEYIVHSKKQVDTNYNCEPIYEITYQEIIFPNIIGVISSLLNGNEKSIFNLFTFDDLKANKIEEFGKIKGSILLKLNSLSVNTNDLYAKLDSIKNELIKISKKYSFENFKKVRPVSDFYEEIVECIQLIPIKEISKEEYKNMCDFFQSKIEVSQMTSDVKKLIRTKNN